MDLADGVEVEVRGSAAKPYVVKNTGGVYSCSCPAWRNQSKPIDARTCKHLRGVRGDEAEDIRVGAQAPVAAGRKPAVKKATAPPVLLAHPWDPSRDPTGWWMSEKLDGVRAYWDGADFISRLGNVYRAPAWFKAGLPRSPLDGELWSGRKQFQRTTSIVRRQDAGNEWQAVSFVVFDAPALAEPFEKRLTALSELFATSPPKCAHLVEQEMCRGADHLARRLAEVEALGAEGLMLRQPGSLYEVGRSWTLLKVKSFMDAEARVVDHLPGAGKHAGRLGALLVEMPDGTQFSVGTGLTDREREEPPPVGSVITYRFQELSRDGVPRFPSYVGMREDAEWPVPR